MRENRLRWFGMFFLETLTAVFVTAILEGPLYRAVPTHTISTILLKHWRLDIECAALFGFVTYRVWKSSSVVWVWVLPALWFVLGVLIHGFRRHASVLYGESGLGYFWNQFGGLDCSNGLNRGAVRISSSFRFPLFARSFFPLEALSRLVPTNDRSRPAGRQTYLRKLMHR
jgi:hypothetical protein